MKPVILSHHQSRRGILADHAIFVVLYVLLALAILWAFQYPGGFAWTFAGITAIVIVIVAVGHTFSIVWKQPHGFTCMLWPDRIACHCPDATLGSTFDLPLERIIEIREDEIGDSRKLVLVATDGGEYWLTSNFGNPDMSFACAIVEQCPKVRWQRK